MAKSQPAASARTGSSADRLKADVGLMRENFDIRLKGLEH